MMDSPVRGFPVSEFEVRLKRAQKLMTVEDLAGILLMTEPEVRYFSGFHTQFWQSPTRPGFFSFLLIKNLLQLFQKLVLL